MVSVFSEEVVRALQGEALYLTILHTLLRENEVDTSLTQKYNLFTLINVVLLKGHESWQLLSNMLN